MGIIKTIWSKYSASTFTKNVSKLTAGTAISQLVSLATAPVLYRIYAKEFYGALGVFMAIGGVLGAISTLQYMQAVILEKEDKDALQALWLVRLINGGFALMTLVYVLLFGEWTAMELKNDLLVDWLILLPLSIFFSGQNELFRVWANRQKKYTIMTVNGILTSVLVPMVSISVGLLHHGPLGLFVGLLVGQVAPSLFLGWQLSRTNSFGWSTLRMNEVKRMAIKHINFPKYSLPAEFINRFSNQLPTFMLSLYSGAGAVAAYNLSVRMLSLPIQLISSSVGEVFRQRATEDYNLVGSCRPIFVKTLKTLTVLSIPPTVLILLFGPFLFTFFFGEQWREAGMYSQILSGLYLIRFIASPLSYVFIIAKKQKQDFWWHIWMLVSSFAAFYFGFYFYASAIEVIAIFGINYFFIYICYLVSSYSYSKKAQV